MFGQSDWQVHISTANFMTQIWIFRELSGGGMEVLYPNSGEDLSDAVYKQFPAGTEPDPPSLRFGIRESVSILRGFADQLSQLGYTTISHQGETLKAKDAHIASAEKQAERLFELVKQKWDPPVVLNVQEPELPGDL